MLLSRQVAVEVEATGSSPWDPIAPFIAGADWAAANLEGAIGAPQDCRTGAGAPCFAFPESSAVLARRAGFDALSLENNHSGDLGPAGRVATRNALSAAGILGVDFEHSPRFVRLGDRMMAVIAIDLIPGADGVFQELPSVALAQKLRLARSLAEVVVVSIHWGRELQEWPSGEQRRAAEWLIDNGADLIVGHHPHVVQPPECLHGRPVFFSLGNHVFDQRDPATKIGLIADCTVDGGRMHCAGVETETRQGSSVPVLRDTLVAPALEKCAVPLGAPTESQGFTLRPAGWTPSAPDAGLTLEGWKDGTVQWRTSAGASVAMQGGVTTAEGKLLLLILERHHSDMDHTEALRPYVYEVGDRGLIARWRGTALAWPLLDAVVMPDGNLCALHRGDSFVRPDPTTNVTRTMQYRWKGFGFAATNDSAGNAACATIFAAVVPAEGVERFKP